MICIRKTNAPAVLTIQGTVATADLHNEYTRTPTVFRRGKKHFTFKDSIYAHDDVKATLRQAQHDKCAFCESKITHIGYGDIEHFRPKGAVRQRETDPLQYPGYYWLAYEWNNLFLSCQLCNQRFKGNCFPLHNPKHRVRSHRGNLSKESPLLIDPTGLPESYLTFVREVTISKNKSAIGIATIEVLGLNRDELLNRRRDRRNVLLALRDTQSLLAQFAAINPSVEIQNRLRKNQTLLDAAITDEAEYAAMARGNPCLSQVSQG